MYGIGYLCFRLCVKARTSHKLGKFLWWSLGDCIKNDIAGFELNLDFLDLMAVILVM